MLICGPQPRIDGNANFKFHQFREVVGADHFIVVEIAFLHRAILKCDGAVHGRRHGVDASALALRQNPLGIGHKAADTGKAFPSGYRNRIAGRQAKAAAQGGDLVGLREGHAAFGLRHALNARDHGLLFFWREGRLPQAGKALQDPV